MRTNVFAMCALTAALSVATVREARKTHEPDPVWAAVEAHLGGADGITVHLREDRRHIQDKDVQRPVSYTHLTLPTNREV